MAKCSTIDCSPGGGHPLVVFRTFTGAFLIARKFVLLLPNFNRASVVLPLSSEFSLTRNVLLSLVIAQNSYESFVLKR